MDWVETKLIAAIEASGYELWVIAGFVVILAVVGAGNLGKNIFGLRQTSAESRKALAEAKAAEQGVMTTLHKYEDAANDSNQKHNLRLADLVEALTANRPAAVLSAKREEVISEYCNDYLRTSGQYVDQYKAAYRDGGTRRRFVASTVLKELDAASEMLHIVNGPWTESLPSRSPLRLDSDTFMKYWALCDEAVHWWNFRLHREVRKRRAEWEKHSA